MLKVSLFIGDFFAVNFVNKLAISHEKIANAVNFLKTSNSDELDKR